MFKLIQTVHNYRGKGTREGKDKTEWRKEGSGEGKGDKG